MDREEADATPAERWRSDLNATCNRLSTQYLTMLKSAAGISTVTTSGGGGNPSEGIDGGAGPGSLGVSGGRRAGGTMIEWNEPPPALAADAALTALQARLAAQNLAAASSSLLDLIRTARLSALLMEERVVAEEEMEECEVAAERTAEASEEGAVLEGELRRLRHEEVNDAKNDSSS